jgi:gliding motility-associated-like protein
MKIFISKARLIIITVFTAKISSVYSQVGWNYQFSLANQEYSSIAGNPNAIQVLDTTAQYECYYGCDGDNEIILGFGTIPFYFTCEDAQIASFKLDVNRSRVIFNNGIFVSSSYDNNFVNQGPRVRATTSGASSGPCLNNVYRLGVEEGNYVSSSKFSSSNNSTFVTEINGNQVCYGNNATSSTGTQIGIVYYTGRIYYCTLGQYPNRKFVVEFKNFHSYDEGVVGCNMNGCSNSPIDLINFQVQLHEGSNAISIHYGNCVYDSSNVWGYSLGYTAGLFNENENCDLFAISGDGSSYTQHKQWCEYITSYENPFLPVNGDYLLWSPVDPIDNDNDGFTGSEGDCDESNANINPNAVEVCDTIDNNCDGIIDEGFDNDNDGITTCSGDCDDANALIYPGAEDTEDDVDNNCDGVIDENSDSDGDGVTPADGDCDDTDASVGPNQPEVCNGIDDNCDDVIDEGFDTDSDGFTTCDGDCDDSNAAINPNTLDSIDGIDNDCDDLIDENGDSDGDGDTPEEGDCNDSNPSIGPSQIEFCNGIDDNCNDLIDENFDADGDGYTTCNGDCNDLNVSINPGVLEENDGLDNDCDDLVDESFDNDGDGSTEEDGDCDDSNPDLSPNTPEICNNTDDNCNGQIDEGLDCSDSEDSIFIPSGFSPNGDGYNDSWNIPWLLDKTGYTVIVVNRWEQVVFQTNNMGGGWDGTHNGQRLPMADYFYVIELIDGAILSGSLTLKY